MTTFLGGHSNPNQTYYRRPKPRIPDSGLKTKDRDPTIPSTVHRVLYSWARSSNNPDPRPNQTNVNTLGSTQQLAEIFN